MARPILDAAGRATGGGLGGRTQGWAADGLPIVDWPEAELTGGLSDQDAEMHPTSAGSWLQSQASVTPEEWLELARGMNRGVEITVEDRYRSVVFQSGGRDLAVVVKTARGEVVTHREPREPWDQLFRRAGLI